MAEEIFHDKGDESHPNKNPNQSGDRHQLALLANIKVSN